MITLSKLFEMSVYLPSVSAYCIGNSIGYILLAEPCQSTLTARWLLGGKGLARTTVGTIHKSTDVETIYELPSRDPPLVNLHSSLSPTQPGTIIDMRAKKQQQKQKLVKNLHSYTMFVYRILILLNHSQFGATKKPAYQC